MGILATIFAKIASHLPGAEAKPAPAAPETPAAPAAAPVAPVPVALSDIDVNAVLSELAGKNPEKLDWKKSIVDLLKILGIDSSLTARTELAKELHYTGDTNDSASMNIWLHKQVIKKFAENGGKVPADLLD